MATTIQYKVKKGDTLSSLGIPAEILKANPGLSKLSAGTVINIPVGTAAKGGITSGGAALSNTGFQSGGNIIPGQQGGAMPGYLPGTSGGKPRQGGTPTGGYNGGMGGPPGGGPNTIWKNGPQVTNPAKGGIPGQSGQYGGWNPQGNTGFQSGANIIPGQGGNTGFQNGSNIIPGQGGNTGFQNGSNIVPGQGGNTGGQYNGGGNSKWIDFQTITPGMSWDEYNSRLRQAQAEGYKGPFLMPDENGVGRLMWDAGRPVQGAVYNDNGTVRGIGRGNITTQSTYSTGGGSPRNNRSMGRGKGMNNNGANDYIGQLLASNPNLALDPNFQLLLQQLGGVQPPSQGNTGGNNAVNGNMNWRF